MSENNALPQPRPITIEDVQRMIGALSMEMEVLRRENAQLKAQLLESMPKGQPA